MGSDEKVQGCGWKTKLPNQSESSERLVYQGPSSIEKNSINVNTLQDALEQAMKIEAMAGYP